MSEKLTKGKDPELICLSASVGSCTQHQQPMEAEKYLHSKIVL